MTRVRYTRPGSVPEPGGYGYGYEVWDPGITRTRRPGRARVFDGGRFFPGRDTMKNVKFYVRYLERV